MDKEQELYNKFVDVLIDKLDDAPSSKDLEVIVKFLQTQNIQATKTHKGLNNLTSSLSKLPFDTSEDELPLRVVK